MAISNAAQCGLLLWKNWLLQKRRIVATTFQILLPTFFALILLLLRLAVESNFVSSPTVWDSFEASTFPPNLTVPKQAGDMKWILVYSPNTSHAATRMALGVTRLLNVTPFPIGTVHRW